MHVVPDAFLALQNKEKSITLKTLEDGPVLLHLVSYSYIQISMYFQFPLRTFMCFFSKHLFKIWFLRPRFICYYWWCRIRWMDRNRRFHFHGWCSTKRWKWIQSFSAIQQQCQILHYYYLVETFQREDWYDVLKDFSSRVIFHSRVLYFLCSVTGWTPKNVGRIYRILHEAQLRQHISELEKRA